MRGAAHVWKCEISRKNCTQIDVARCAFLARMRLPLINMTRVAVAVVVVPHVWVVVVVGGYLDTHTS